MDNVKLIFSFLLFISLMGCGDSDEWICKSGTNANGDAVQYSENIKTGEMGVYSKCQNN